MGLGTGVGHAYLLWANPQVGCTALPASPDAHTQPKPKTLTPTKKAARTGRPLYLFSQMRRLTLGELEALTGFRTAKLLTFHNAAVARQEACRLERATQAGIIKLQRLGDAVLDRTGLTREAAALDRRHHVKLIFRAGHRKRLAQDHLKHGTCKIDLHFLAVHHDLAGARLDPDTGDRVLPLAGGIGTTQVVTHGFARGDNLGGGCLDTVSHGFK